MDFTLTTADLLDMFASTTTDRVIDDVVEWCGSPNPYSRGHVVDCLTVIDARAAAGDTLAAVNARQLRSRFDSVGQWQESVAQFVRDYSWIR